MFVFGSFFHGRKLCHKGPKLPKRYGTNAENCVPNIKNIHHPCSYKQCCRVGSHKDRFRFHAKPNFRSCGTPEHLFIRAR